MKIIDLVISQFYNFFTFFVRKCIGLTVVFSPKIKLFVAGQKQISGVLDDIKTWRKQNQNKDIIWFHCASLGEFEQGRPVLETFKSQNPNYGILLTFFSPSGYEIRKNYPLADFICYLPIDTRSNAQDFVKTVNPKIAVFVKYEFWPNIIKALKTNSTTIIGISVILRENQAFFKPWGGFFRNILFSFDHLFVQNQTTGDLLKSIDYEDYTIAGDTRFDRVLDNAAKVRPIPEIEEFIGHHQVFLVGSAWPEDMEVLIPFIFSNSQVKFIIAPHELHVSQMNEWASKLNAAMYSDFKASEHQNRQVLIIDSIGMLSALYQYAHYAYVGGGFGKGLHNILEAAVFGVPIFFGDKSYLKFEEAKDLIDRRVAYPIKDLKELSQTFENLNSTILLEIKKSSAEYVNAQSGATDTIVKFLAKI